jgi:hypothetical protein
MLASKFDQAAVSHEKRNSPRPLYETERDTH